MLPIPQSKGQTYVILQFCGIAVFQKFGSAAWNSPLSIKKAANEKKVARYYNIALKTPNFQALNNTIHLLIAIRMKHFETGQIKNVAVLGHAGCGKTTLAETMLFEAGKCGSAPEQSKKATLYRTIPNSNTNAVTLYSIQCYTSNGKTTKLMWFKIARHWWFCGRNHISPARRQHRRYRYSMPKVALK